MEEIILKIMGFFNTLCPLMNGPGRAAYGITTNCN